MEAPHNTPTPASTPHIEAAGQQRGADEQCALPSKEIQDQETPAGERATIRLAVEYDAQKLLLATEKDLSTAIKGKVEAVQQTERHLAELLEDVREHESVKATDTSKVVLKVEEEARQLLIEAEAHESVRVALHDARTFENFWLKCMNDWVLNFASGLAYSLLMAMFPIVIALAAGAGFISGNLSLQTQNELVAHLDAIFPVIIGHQSQNVLDPALSLLRRNAGFLSILAVVLALFNGSRLFVALEDYFDIIYHTPARPFWRQNGMAISMLLIFIVLIPIMLLASSTSVGGFLGGLFASWLLFQTIYLVVPNQHISLRRSWLGALAAACALQIYVAIFPLYVKHFMGSYNGDAGFAVILLLFFYYFAVILLLGAEVNAFYAEGIRGTPDNIAGLVHQATLVGDQRELARLIQQKTTRHSTKQ